MGGQSEGAYEGVGRARAVNGSRWLWYDMEMLMMLGVVLAVT